MRPCYPGRRTHDELQPRKILNNTDDYLPPCSNKPHHVYRNLPVCMAGIDIAVAYWTVWGSNPSGGWGGDFTRTAAYKMGAGSFFGVKAAEALCWLHTQPIYLLSYTLPPSFCALRKLVTGSPLPCTFNKVCNSSSYAEFCGNLLAGQLSHSLPKLVPLWYASLNHLNLPRKSNNPTLSLCFKTAFFILAWPLHNEKGINFTATMAILG